MRNFVIVRFAVMLSLLCFVACERIVDIQIPDATPRLVVEARLERALDFPAVAQSIKLSTTANYFDGEFPPPASGATVTLTDDLNRITAFTESATRGTYVAPNSFTVGRGRKYTLTVDYAGERYRATDSTRNVPRITSLYFDTPSGGRYSGTGGVRATIDWVDPANTKNFYLWEMFVNGVRQTGPDSTVLMRIIGNDQIYNGLRVDGFQPFEGIDIQLNATVIMRQIAISEATYRYYFAFNDQLAGDGSPFAVPPASLHGNVQNLTTPTRPALGYFYVSEVSQRTAQRTPPNPPGDSLR